MNPFPQTIFTPKTAHRIPRTTGTDCVVAKLLEFDINASAFLMEPDLLASLESEDFANDFDRAFDDFYYQIPVEIRRQVFPLPPEVEGVPQEPEVHASGGMGQQKPPSRGLSL